MLLLSACTSNYALNVNKPASYDQKLSVPFNVSVTCKERVYHSQTNLDPRRFCEKEQFKKLLSSDVEIAITGKVQIEKKAYRTGVSPAMIFFLGLIPAGTFYDYHITAQLIKFDGSQFQIDQKYKVTETWGTWNTIKAIFGMTVSQEQISRAMLIDIEQQLLQNDAVR